MIERLPREPGRFRHLLDRGATEAIATEHEERRIEDAVVRFCLRPLTLHLTNLTNEDEMSNHGFVARKAVGRIRACTHLWTPREMQAIFEEDRHVVGCCHLSGL